MNPSARQAGAVAAVLLLWLAAAGPAAAAERRTYTMDNDPLRLGNKALEAGRVDEARTRFEEAVANDHHVDESVFGLALCDLREGRYPEAEARFNQALAARGGNWPAARAELGLLLLRRGRSDEAAAAFEAALAGDAKSWAARYGQARLKLAASDWKGAAKLLEAGRNRKGLADGEDRYHYAHALWLLGTGDTDAAEIEALRAQNLDPIDPLYTALVARAYQAQGHDALAITALEQVLAASGATPNAVILHELGALYDKTGRVNEARERYQQAVTADSTYVPALRDLADLFRRADRPEMAAATWLRYVAVAPADLEARLKLVVALRDLGRFDESAAAARAARDLAPDDAAARLAFVQSGLRARDPATRDEAATLAATLPPSITWQTEDLLALAEWQSSQDRDADAVATLARAAAGDPTNASIPFQKGLLELRAGRAAAAAISFERSVALDPASAAAHLNLGIARYQGGSPREAIGDFRRAVALNDELTAGRLLLAQALTAVDSLTAAEQTYRSVLKSEPENAKALRGVGFCRLRAGDYQGAAGAYDRATNAEPGNVDGWAGLGGARLGLGRLDDAEAAFARARKIDPNNAMLKTGTELLNQARLAGKDTQSR